jgi:hypothetical protein
MSARHEIRKMLSRVSGTHMPSRRRSSWGFMMWQAVERTTQHDDEGERAREDGEIIKAETPEPNPHRNPQPTLRR